MSVELNENGMSIPTFDELLSDIQDDWRAGLGDDIATSEQSTFGIIQRIQARREHNMAETMLYLYQMLDARTAEGVLQDRLNSLLGITREGDEYAEVLGTATGTATTVIPDGTQVSVGGYVFQTIDGPYTIGGGGTVTGVRVQALSPGPIDVATLGAWTVVDTLSGDFTAFDDTSQPIPGRLVESPSEYRARAEVERFRRAQGPLRAIEASVYGVLGVTYVRAYENVDVDPVDSDGIPLYAINVVVEGGDDEAVALAIRSAMPAGHPTHGTDVSVLVTVGPDTRTITFDRVTEIDLWVDVDYTTSSSEEFSVADLTQATKDALMDYVHGAIDPSTGLRSTTTGAWQIGKDVLPARLASVLAGFSGVDDLTVTTSLDGVSYAGGKRSISIRERAVLDEARITISEV